MRVPKHTDIRVYTYAYENNTYVELIMPGFANHKYGKFFDCEQEVDNAGSPVLVFNLGKGRPIMRSHPVTMVLHGQMSPMF